MDYSKLATTGDSEILVASAGSCQEYLITSENQCVANGLSSKTCNAAWATVSSIIELQTCTACFLFETTSNFRVSSKGSPHLKFMNQEHMDKRILHNHSTDKFLNLSNLLATSKLLTDSWLTVFNPLTIKFVFSRRHRGLLGRPSSSGPIHAPIGGPLLGHFGANFTEAGSDPRHFEKRPEERLPSHAKTESRACLRRAGEADAGAEDLSHVSGLLRRDARDEEAQARFQQLQEMLPGGERLQRSG